MPQRALIYLRVSTPGQAVQENPIETQREVCLEYAKKLDYFIDPVEDIFVDGGLTGRNDKRDAFREMTERLITDPMVFAVIAYDMSRIFRNGVEFFNFEKRINKYGKRFISVTEPIGNDSSPSGFFLKWILAGTHQFRSMQDGEKIRDGMLNKARSGMYPGYAPFGYRNAREILPNGKDNRWMETNHIEAPWVLRAFTEYGTGLYSLYDLANRLSQAGFPTRKKRPLSSGELESILKSKTYIGWIVWGGVSHPNGKQDKLVSEELFNRVQSVFSARSNGSSKKRRFTFILRGITFCGECGSRWTAAYHKGKTKTYPLYSCQKRIKSVPQNCHQPYISVVKLEKQFLLILKKVQISGSVADKLREKIIAILGKEREVHDKLSVSISASVSATETKKRNLLDKYIEGQLDDITYHQYNSRLDDDLLKYRVELEKIDGNVARVTKIIQMAIDLANNCHRAFKRANKEEKTILVQAMFEKLVVQDKRIISVTLNAPLNFICKQKIQGSDLFKYTHTGGDGEN